MHLNRILQSISDYNLRKRLTQQVTNPMPKLAVAETLASNIDTLTKAVPTGNSIRWYDAVDLKQHTVTARLCNLSNFYAKKTPDEVSTIAEAALFELRAKGCNAHIHQHEMPKPGGGVIIDYCLAVPCTKPILVGGKPSVVSDEESANIFIAYLLDKGYATEAEITAVFR